MVNTVNTIQGETLNANNAKNAKKQRDQESRVQKSREQKVQGSCNNSIYQLITKKNAAVIKLLQTKTDEFPDKQRLLAVFKSLETNQKCDNRYVSLIQEKREELKEHTIYKKGEKSQQRRIIEITKDIFQVDPINNTSRYIKYVYKA